MAIIDNHPTFSYCSYKNMMITYNGEKYSIQNSSTNLKYVYWDVTNPYTLTATNVKRPEIEGRYLVFVNEKGLHTLLPYDDLIVSFDGDNLDLITDQIVGIYEQVDGIGEKFVAVETTIDGVKQTVGEVKEEQNKVKEEITQIKQTATDIELSVSNVTKEFQGNKELTELRENLNKSIIDYNSDLGIFKSKVLEYIKDEKISNEERTEINIQLDILDSRKADVLKYVATVISIAENNNETDKVNTLNSAKIKFENAVDNLKNYLSTAISDGVIVPSEITGISNMFASSNTAINLLKNTCDDVIFLGVGGSVSTELARIGLSSSEISLRVEKTEQSLKEEVNLAKNELSSQIGDVNSALGDFQEVVNTTFKDGILDETEKQMLLDRITVLDREKLDIDKQYKELYENPNLTDPTKSQLKIDYDSYVNKHNQIKTKIEEVTSDGFINDAEKIQINTLFTEYATSLATIHTSMNKALEVISYNKASQEVQDAKNEMQGQIDDVLESLGSLGDVIDGTFEDNVLDEAERKIINQNLNSLATEKVDIDKQYQSLYNNSFLTGQDKTNLKTSYDEYIVKYNDLVNIINGILTKETLIDNVDRVNLNSALTKHDEKLALFVAQANKAIDVIASNRVNSAKEELKGDIKDVTDSVTSLSETMNGAFKDFILDETEKVAIKQSLNTLNKEKLDIDAQYKSLYENSLLNSSLKNQLKTLYDIYISKYNLLITQINNILNLDELIPDDIDLFDSLYAEHNLALVELSKKVSECIDSIASKKVEDSKKELSSNIEEVKNSVSNLSDTMEGAFKDGILTEAEKNNISQHLRTLASEKSDIDKQYETLYANENLIDPYKANLKTSYDSYIVSYNSLVTVINNILNKEGLIDSTDQTRLNNAFKEHDSKLGEYTKQSHNAIDAIVNKISNDKADKVDKKFAEIILNPETGIQSIVGHLTQDINGEGGIKQRLQTAEQKITPEGIANVVKDTQLIKDIDGKITANTTSISKVEQTSKSITSRVDGLDGKYTQLKQTVDGIDITGKVSFYDLRTAGATVINGSNISTGTIDTNRVNIKGGTTKKIVIANDNYCVYDGSETDVNRKIFMGFRTNVSTNVPTVILGYNGVNPNVDGAVVSGGTYTTYSHYPNNNNPESINQSYGALAFKYGARETQFSTLNMYQNGDIDLKAGSGIYFRPSLRAKDNHVFAIADKEVGCRVPFKCTSTIYTNGDITTDRGLYSTYLSVQGDAGVSNKFNASKLVTNRIDVYGDSNLDGNTYISGSCTIANTLNVRNRPIYGMGSITLDRGTIYLPQGGGNNTTDYVRIGFGIIAGVSSGNFHFLTMNASPANLYASNVRSAYSLEPNSRLSDISALEQIDAINVVNTSEGLRLNTPINKSGIDESKVVTKVYNEKTNQEEINVDYNCAISTLWKAIQELKQENEELKKQIQNIENINVEEVK